MVSPLSFQFISRVLQEYFKGVLSLSYLIEVPLVFQCTFNVVSMLVGRLVEKYSGFRHKVSQNIHSQRSALINS